MKIPLDWSSFPNINAYFERMRVEAWARTAPKNYVGRKPKAAVA